MDFHFMQLVKTNYFTVYFNIKIISNLASGSPFGLASLSFYYVTNILWAHSYFWEKMFQAYLSFPYPTLRGALNLFYLNGEQLWETTYHGLTGDAVVNTSASSAEGRSSVPSQETKIPHTLQPKIQNVKQAIL